MFVELYRYFISSRSLSLSGIGTLQLDRQPACYNFSDKLIQPPVFSVSCKPGNTGDDSGLIAWLATDLQISRDDAAEKYEAFIKEFREQLSSGSEINWNGIGNFKQNDSGQLGFIPGGSHSGQMPVAAEKLIRENAEHAIKVGEEIRTSTQMQSRRVVKTKKDKLSWLAPVLLFLASAGFISWYFMQNGFSISSVSNQQAVFPTDSKDNYKILQN
jgi:hypothetical protein